MQFYHFLRWNWTDGLLITDHEKAEERNKKGIFRLVNHGFAPVQHNTTPACIAWEAREKMEKEVFHCKLSSIICSLFLHICMWCGSLLVMYLFIYSLITRKMLKPSNRNDSWMCFYSVSSQEHFNSHLDISLPVYSI